MYIYTHIPTYMCVCVHVCMRACMRACVHACVHVYLTGFWKTDQIVTLGLLNFIAPAKLH